MFFDQCFVLASGEGEQIIELCPGGQDRKLTRQNAEEYIELTVKAMLNRAAPQMAKVREGIEFICGSKLLAALSWRYAEERCIGKYETDIEYLKKYTSHEGHFRKEDSKTRKWFWEIFEEMAEEDRQLYLRFINGQAKLPTDMSKLRYKHALRSKGGGDTTLPEAHTCYFQIDIPEYSTKEIFRKLLLVAVRFCGEVDGDSRVTY